jgi:hypothetical protein
MSKRKVSGSGGGDARQPSAAKNRHGKIFARRNRGRLLDIVIFVLNLFLMRLLTRQYIDFFRRASDDNSFAKLIIGLTFLGMFVLPASGAVLKRWHFHQRLKARAADYGKSALSGCLFNPIFYFCLNLVIMATVIAALGEQIFGKALMNNGTLFITLTFTGLAVTMVQTYLIYNYFSPPKHAPQSDFMRSPHSETLGDICIFLNMILFQVAWNLLTFSSLSRVSSFSEFAGRLFFICFAAMLIYFPPRIFYLAEDINRPFTWLTMLLANSPVIIRILYGTGS